MKVKICNQREWFWNCATFVLSGMKVSGMWYYKGRFYLIWWNTSFTGRICHFLCWKRFIYAMLSVISCFLLALFISSMRKVVILTLYCIGWDATFYCCLRWMDGSSSFKYFGYVFLDFGLFVIFALRYFLPSFPIIA